MRIWYKRLGHIFQKRIIYLIKSDILRPLNMSDFGPCAECAKEKQMSMRKYTTNWVPNVPKLIHMDICGPFPTAIRNGQTYFISFIDDNSWYGYIWIIIFNIVWSDVWTYKLYWLQVWIHDHLLFQKRFNVMDAQINFKSDEFWFLNDLYNNFKVERFGSIIYHFKCNKKHFDM